MPKKSTYLFLLLAFAQLQCKSQKVATAYSSENLRIIPISDHSFIHVSYLNTSEYGKVSCNGLIFISNGHAVVFDTPTNSEASEELLKWLTENKKSRVTAVVINHYHVDCLGGLITFHESGIASYANNETIKLAQKDVAQVPQNGFDQQDHLDVSGRKIINRYFGEAHTSDNIISYIPDEELLFGGCMIKSIGAKKGNLANANLEKWSNTVKKIKTEYPSLKTVVPGHGAHGGRELLDYTIALFEIK